MSTILPCRRLVSRLRKRRAESETWLGHTFKLSSSKLSSKIELIWDQQPFADSLNLKREQSDKRCRLQKRRATQNLDPAQAHDLVVKLVPSPWRRPKNENISFSKKLVAEGSPTYEFSRINRATSRIHANSIDSEEIGFISEGKLSQNGANGHQHHIYDNAETLSVGSVAPGKAGSMDNLGKSWIDSRLTGALTLDAREAKSTHIRGHPAQPRYKKSWILHHVS